MPAIKTKIGKKLPTSFFLVYLQVIPIESIGNSFWTSYKGISYRFYSFVPMNINSEASGFISALHTLMEFYRTEEMNLGCLNLKKQTLLLHHENFYVLQVSKNGPQQNFQVCLTISVFTQACFYAYSFWRSSSYHSLYVSRKQKLCCFHHFYYIKTFLKQASDTNLHPSNVGDSTTYKIPPTHEKKIPSEKKKIP